MTTRRTELIFDMERFSQFVGARIKSRGLSNRKAAAQIGIDHTMLSRLINNRRCKSPDVDTYCRIMEWTRWVRPIQWFVKGKVRGRKNVV